MTQAVGFGFGATFCGSCLLYWCCVYKLTPSTYDTIYIVLLNSRSPLAIRQNVASWPRLCAKKHVQYLPRYCSVRNIIHIMLKQSFWFDLLLIPTLFRHRSWTELKLHSTAPFRGTAKTNAKQTKIHLMCLMIWYPCYWNASSYKDRRPTAS